MGARVRVTRTPKLLVNVNPALPKINNIVLNSFYRHKTFQTEKSRTARGYQKLQKNYQI